MNTSKDNKIKAADFDTAFEKGDVSAHLDLKSVKTFDSVTRPSVKQVSKSATPHAIK